MTMISENWPLLLAPGLRSIFHLRMRERDAMYKRTDIFSVQSSQRAYEDHLAIGELGTAGWNEFEQAGRVPYDAFDKGEDTRFEHKEYAMGVVIQRKLMDDNLYAEAGIPSSVTGRVEKLADSAAVHREKVAAGVFNSAFSTTGTAFGGFDVLGADGDALCDDNHTDPGQHQTDQDNRGTSALSKTSLRDTDLLMREFKDDRGELISSMPDTLIVPPELGDTALILVNSVLDPESAENAINVRQGRYKVVIWDYLTDANNWWLSDSMLQSQHLIWYDRIAPEFQTTPDFDTLQGKFRGYYRLSRGWSDFRFLYGHEVA